MNDTDQRIKYDYDKIALLGLFVLSLVSASFVVFFKSRLLFSDPIRLPQTGLSVSMPSGSNWQCENQWSYQDNLFTLSSLFPHGSGRPTGWAICRYLLSAETTTPRIRFERRAAAIDAAVSEIRQIKTDTITIDYARIEIPELNFCMFFGTSRLSDNKQLDIEVGQIAGEIELTEGIFKHIIESLTFEDNRLIREGVEIVAEIKRRGIHSFLNNQNQQVYFFIKDDTKQNIGFTMDMIFTSATSTQHDIRARSQFYIKGQNFVDHITVFQCSNNLDEFVYNSQTNRWDGKSGAEIVLDPKDIITIKKFETQSDEKKYQLGPAMIPDVFLDQILMQMLDSKKDQIIINIIEATGKIIPTQITAINVAQDSATDNKTAYIFKLELRDGRGYSEKQYLNEQKQVYKRLAQQDKMYILERTDAENIEKEFPDYAERGF